MTDDTHQPRADVRIEVRTAESAVAYELTTQEAQEIAAIIGRGLEAGTAGDPKALRRAGTLADALRRTLISHVRLPTDRRIGEAEPESYRVDVEAGTFERGDE